MLVAKRRAAAEETERFATMIARFGKKYRFDVATDVINDQTGQILRGHLKPPEDKELLPPEKPSAETFDAAPSDGNDGNQTEEEPRGEAD